MRVIAFVVGLFSAAPQNFDTSSEDDARQECIVARHVLPECESDEAQDHLHDPVGCLWANAPGLAGGGCVTVVHVCE